MSNSREMGHLNSWSPLYVCISETIPSLSVRLYLYQTIPTTLVGWSVAGPGRRCGRRRFVAPPAGYARARWACGGGGSSRRWRGSTALTAALSGSAAAGAAPAASARPPANATMRWFTHSPITKHHCSCQCFILYVNMLGCRLFVCLLVWRRLRGRRACRWRGTWWPCSRARRSRGRAAPPRRRRRPPRRSGASPAARGPAPPPRPSPTAARRTRPSPVAPSGAPRAGRLPAEHACMHGGWSVHLLSSTHTPPEKLYNKSSETCTN